MKEGRLYFWMQVVGWEGEALESLCGHLITYRISARGHVVITSLIRLPCWMSSAMPV